MKKISLCIDYHLKNKIFDLSDIKTNRDQCNYSMYLLKEELKKSGVDLSTYDINSPEESDISFYFDYNKDLGWSKINYLFLFESKLIRPKGWQLEVQNKFDKIFTWDDSLVDNKRFFKINFTNKLPSDEAEYSLGMQGFREKKLCTLISGNKRISHKLELYSERIKTIKWFEENAIDDFEFYGLGWNKNTSSNRYFRFFMSIIDRWRGPKYLSYKGSVDSKNETLKNYKFAVCYENAQKIPGYITEKIFDCFIAGCVPIYWGASNISEHIPTNCFIDRRSFNSHEDLYTYLKNMGEKEYLSIQKNIKEYLFSNKSDPFCAESFVNIVLKHLGVKVEA